MKWLIGWNVVLTVFLIWLSIVMFFPNVWGGMWPEPSFFEMREVISDNTVEIISINNGFIDLIEDIEVGINQNRDAILLIIELLDEANDH